MNTRRIPSPQVEKTQTQGLRPFAAVLAIAIAAFGAIACSNRLSSVAPLQAHGTPAPAASWPSAASDPSLPSAAQLFQGTTAEPDGPTPTF